MIENLSNITGIIGVGLILLAYFLNIFSLLKKDGILYYNINIIGAAIACFSAILIRFFPFIILEGVWTVVSVIGLLRAIKKPQV